MIYFLSQVGIFGEVDRYPQHRVVSILYCALVKPEMFELLAGSHAKEVSWLDINSLGKLPFDHNKMLDTALNWFKGRIVEKTHSDKLITREISFKSNARIISVNLYRIQLTIVTLEKKLSVKDL